MTDGRLRRGARRVGASLVLGLLVLLSGWVLAAPRAAADQDATVYLRDLTPPVVSVNAGGTVTFINQIADKRINVGVGPLAVTAVVHTDVTVNLPSGSHTVQPTAAAPPGKPQPTAKDLDQDPKKQQFWTEKFDKSCLTCTISYAYRVEGAQLTQVLNQLPKLPAVPTPFVVNTILPLPNLPGVNIPPLPQINVQPPQLPSPLPGAPNQGTVPGQDSVTTTITTTTTTRQGVGGPLAEYSLNGVTMSPSGAAVRAFDPSRLPTGQNGGRADAAAMGNPDLATNSATRPAQSGLSLPPLLALVSLAGVGTWWVRTYLHRVLPDR